MTSTTKPFTIELQTFRTYNLVNLESWEMDSYLALIGFSEEERKRFADFPEVVCERFLQALQKSNFEHGHLESARQHQYLKGYRADRIKKFLEPLGQKTVDMLLKITFKGKPRQ